MTETRPQSPSTRLDYSVIQDFVKSHTRVLDLGCGDGELLSLLIRNKGCQGAGIEIDERMIYQCIEKGLSVSHGDISAGLTDYSDKRFDYVILNESLQQVLHPQTTILEALRVGRRAIVGIPNFCHLVSRAQIFFRGRVPMTPELPYEWYNTPNLRFFSLKDFQSFCKTNGIHIVGRKALGRHRIIKIWPNLFAHIGIYLLKKDG